ncbi:MAG: response regulator [Caldilineae bacterium]|nr:MAG: response regulator [Caldilineae bacterium]
MSIVALFSASHCRVDDVARLLVERTGYRLVTTEQLIEDAAGKFSVSEKKLRRTVYGPRPLFENITRERGRHIAYLRMALAEAIQDDDIVHHGFTMHLLPRSLTHVLRVCLVAGLEFRLAQARQAGLEGGKAGSQLEKDDEQCRQWTVALTGLGPWDKRHYDAVIPMDDTSPEAVAEELIAHLAKPVLASGPHTAAAARDFLLSARVGVVLAESGHEVDVECEGGKVTLIINKFVMRLDKYKQEVTNLARQVEGVAQAEARVGPGYQKPAIYPKLDLPQKILLVDDEKEFVHTLSERLQTRNLGAAAAYDGEQALQIAEQDAPDVMVLDLKMPGIDGLEVLRRIKKDHPCTQVIILTGHGSEAERRLALELGAFAYLNKPVDIDVLAQTMRDAYTRAAQGSAPAVDGD